MLIKGIKIILPEGGNLYGFGLTPALPTMASEADATAAGYVVTSTSSGISPYLMTDKQRTNATFPAGHGFAIEFPEVADVTAYNIGCGSDRPPYVDVFALVGADWVLVDQQTNASMGTDERYDGVIQEAIDGPDLSGLDVVAPDEIVEPAGGGDTTNEADTTNNSATNEPATAPTPANVVNLTDARNVVRSYKNLTGPQALAVVINDGEVAFAVYDALVDGADYDTLRAIPGVSTTKATSAMAWWLTQPDNAKRAAGKAAYMRRLLEGADDQIIAEVIPHLPSLNADAWNALKPAIVAALNTLSDSERTALSDMIAA
ncbi:MAG: hypothetical protein H6926_04040 [Chromatiales bacterium]|nr:hypothetical protein [Gammaproteobacteria bacterium]MCP5352345.1 hypothetical protein [Chromatiales bacterium]